jgi:hypothetical protein
MKTSYIPVLLFVCALALEGCTSATTYSRQDVTIESPRNDPSKAAVPAEVASLSPTFSWKTTASKSPVDFAIWEGKLTSDYASNKDPQHTPTHERGAQVYSADKITGGEHTITIALKPDMIYFWSIKPSGSAKWLTMYHTVIWGDQSKYEEGVYPSIHTPQK